MATERKDTLTSTFSFQNNWGICIETDAWNIINGKVLKSKDL